MFSDSLIHCQCELRVEIFGYNKNNMLHLAVSEFRLKQSCNPLNLQRRIQSLIRIVSNIIFILTKLYKLE